MTPVEIVKEIFRISLENFPGRTLEKIPEGTPGKNAENNSRESPGKTLGTRASGADPLIPDFTQEFWKILTEQFREELL